MGDGEAGAVAPPAEEPVPPAEEPPAAAFQHGAPDESVAERGVIDIRFEELVFPLAAESVRD
jgi:hypothetical protein